MKRRNSTARSVRSATLVALLLQSLAGCADHKLAEPAGKFDAGTHVTVIRDEGDFTLIEREDGVQGYVPTARLVNTRESDDNKVYAITSPTEFYETLPQQVPPPPAPRPARDISRARDELPVLFLTESGREVYRSRMTAEPSFDPETKEILWFAMTCTNPDCPARDQGTNGRPFLFIYPDPDWKVGPDGLYNAVGPGRQRGDTLIKEKGSITAQCPACLKIRNPNAESAAERARYDSWVRHYTLPEATARAEQLNQEHKRRIELDR